MSILKREALYSVKGGQVKFLDWAITQTTLGVCAEPFTVNSRRQPSSGALDFDSSDMMVKVDSLQQVADDDQAVRALSFGSATRLHGGNLQPRVLIFTGNS